MKSKSMLAAVLAALLLFTLTACAGTPAVELEALAVQAEPSPAAQPEAAEPTPAEEDAVWTLNPADVTDAYLTDTVIRLPELALSSLGFAFDSPDELTSQQLYMLFLAWTAQEELNACYDAADGVYVFDAAVICRTLDCYLEGYCFTASDCLLYDAGKDAIVTPMAGGFGGWLDVQLESRAFNGNTAALTALLDGSVRKVYTITFYDGGYRYQSVQQLSQPEARPCVGAMLLSGEQTDAFAAVTDEEICLWDAASGGRLLAVARFPYALSGAKDALAGCDFTDLDGDGNSELSAAFSFADGSTASLLWFYTDGSLVYNEEFSILPGEAPAGDAE